MFMTFLLYEQQGKNKIEIMEVLYQFFSSYFLKMQAAVSGD